MKMHLTEKDFNLDERKNHHDDYHIKAFRDLESELAAIQKRYLAAIAMTQTAIKVATTAIAERDKLFNQLKELEPNR